METREKMELIDQAIALVEEAQGLVDEAVQGTSIKGNYEAYGKYGFNQLLGNGNPYDNGLQTIIDEMDCPAPDPHYGFGE